MLNPVTPTSNVSTAAASSNASSARIADNFDQFLQLLTTQLRNQSPLDPLDTNQFTQQLVQFAGVEQQIKTNDSLSALLVANKTSTLTNALNFVGASVTADGSTTALKDGKATWQLNAPRAGTMAYVITDRNGNQVQSGTRTLSGGDQTFVWDGKTANGQIAQAGDYTITIAAKDSNSQTITVKTEVSGVVDAVDVTGSEPILKIGGVSIPMSKVKSVIR
jgi:flagellar basal-body rod modification protein FlgD